MVENSVVIENVLEQPIEGQKKESAKKGTHARNRLTALIGALILIFSAIGFVTTIVLASNWIISIVENQPEKDKFANFIYPLVIPDPPAFDDISKLKPSTILAAAGWDLIINGDTSKYEKDEFGFMTVPQTDLEVHATKLFGEGLTFDHQSVGDAEFSFTYNEEAQTYNLPDSLVYFSNIPRVTEIQRQDNQIHLRVDYLIPSMGLNISDKDEKVTKIMEYILEETQDGGYKIVAVETILSGNAVLGESSSESSSTLSSVGSKDDEE